MGNKCQYHFLRDITITTWVITRTRPTSVTHAQFFMFGSGNLIGVKSIRCFNIIRFKIYHWNIWINLKCNWWIKSSQKHSLNIVMHVF
jgi:hypothetical protein